MFPQLQLPVRFTSFTTWSGDNKCSAGVFTTTLKLSILVVGNKEIERVERVVDIRK